MAKNSISGVVVEGVCLMPFCFCHVTPKYLSLRSYYKSCLEDVVAIKTEIVVIGW